MNRLEVDAENWKKLGSTRKLLEFPSFDNTSNIHIHYDGFSILYEISD